jgi:hypothetical protein
MSAFRFCLLFVFIGYLSLSAIGCLLSSLCYFFCLLSSAWYFLLFSAIGSHPRKREARSEFGSVQQYRITPCLNKLRLGYIRMLGWAHGSTARPPQTKSGMSIPWHMAQFARITCLEMLDSCPRTFWTCRPCRWLFIHSCYICLYCLYQSAQHFFEDKVPKTLNWIKLGNFMYSMENHFSLICYFRYTLKNAILYQFFMVF